MLELLGGLGCLRCQIDVIGGDKDLVTYFELHVASMFICTSFLIGFGQGQGIHGNLGGIG